MDAVRYLLVAAVAAFMIFFGYRMINSIIERGCSAQIAQFEIEMKNFGDQVRFGSRESQIHSIPCKAEKIYLFDSQKMQDPSKFNQIPMIKDMLESESKNNIFLIKGGDVMRTFDAGYFELESSYVCLRPSFDKVHFLVEGAGGHGKIIIPSGQSGC